MTRRRGRGKDGFAPGEEEQRAHARQRRPRASGEVAREVRRAEIADEAPVVCLRHVDLFRAAGLCLGSANHPLLDEIDDAGIDRRVAARE